MHGNLTPVENSRAGNAGLALNAGFPFWNLSCSFEKKKKNFLHSCKKNKKFKMENLDSLVRG